MFSIDSTVRSLATFTGALFMIAVAVILGAWLIVIGTRSPRVIRARAIDLVRRARVKYACVLDQERSNMTRIGLGWWIRKRTMDVVASRQGRGWRGAGGAVVVALGVLSMLAM